MASLNTTVGRGRSATDVGESWSITDATELYEIAHWGKGYFSIGPQGHVLVHPSKDPAHAIDLKQLVDRLVSLVGWIRT
jgi:arginine decarboxylase